MDAVSFLLARNCGNFCIEELAVRGGTATSLPISSKLGKTVCKIIAST